MRIRRSGSRVATLAGIGIMLACAGVVASACGARTGIHEGSRRDGGGFDGAPGSCVVDSDCVSPEPCVPQTCVRNFCVAGEPITCDDGDPCTEDLCVSEAGGCEFRALARDEDGDGFLGPRPGFAAGARGSCGDDCDDTSPMAFPGGREICDGVDNDCNGVIDDRARFVSDGREPVQISSDFFQTERGGVAFTGDYYAVTYAGRAERGDESVLFFHGVSPSGRTAAGLDETAITLTNSDAFPGPVEWTGSTLGVAWHDRREGRNFEIFFNRLNADGSKLGPDARITMADGFSVDPATVWTGADFVVVWADDRRRSGVFQIFGRRIAPDGRLLGDEAALTAEGIGTTGPSLAQGDRNLGLAYKRGPPGSGEIEFRTLSPDLADLGPSRLVTSNGAINPRLVFNGGRYTVVWEQKIGSAPGPSIQAAVLDSHGDVVIGERAIATSPAFARAPAVLPLGDRLLVLWADQRDGDYDLYTRMVSADLEPLGPAEQVTSLPGDSTAPTAVFGPDGDVGIFFMSDPTARRQVYFARLVCVAGDGA